MKDKTEEAFAEAVEELKAMEPDGDGDEYIEDFLTALDQKRLQFGVIAPTDRFFNVRLLGGRWLLEHQHRPYDAFQGYITEGTDASDWATLYHINKSARFDINLVGEGESFCLAKAWVERAQHFYDIWVGQHLHHLVYTPADINAVPESEQFKALFTHGTKAQRTGAKRVRALLPKL